MDHHTRERRWREIEVRRMERLAHTPTIAVTWIAQSANERESTSRARLSDGKRIAARVQRAGIASSLR